MSLAVHGLAEGPDPLRLEVCLGIVHEIGPVRTKSISETSFSQTGLCCCDEPAPPLFGPSLKRLDILLLAFELFCCFFWFCLTCWRCGDVRTDDVTNWIVWLRQLVKGCTNNTSVCETAVALTSALVAKLEQNAGFLQIMHLLGISAAPALLLVSFGVELVTFGEAAEELLCELVKSFENRHCQVTVVSDLGNLKSEWISLTNLFSKAIMTSFDDVI